MLDHGSLRVTASVGVAALLDSDEVLKDVLKRADDALYAAKNGGRDQVIAAGGLPA